MTEQQRLVTLPLSEAPLHFASSAELRDWCARERERWAWVTWPTDAKGRVPERWKKISSVASHYGNFFNGIERACSEYDSDTDLTKFQDALTRIVQDLVANRKVAIGGTVHGSRVLAVLDRHGGADSEEGAFRATRAIYFTAMTDDGHEIDQAYLKQIIPGLIDYASEVDSSGQMETAVAEMMRRATDELVRRQKELDDCIREHNDTRNNWNSSIKEALERFSEVSGEAIRSIEEVQDRFQTQMGLQAPAQYWLKKSASHEQRAKRYRGTLVWFGIFGLVSVAAAYAGVFFYVTSGIEDVQNELSASLLAFGGLAVLTTGVLWTARIVSRLHLSEHHLALDAAERSTMVTTFLALAHDNAVGPEERAIVLTALFRPTADGVVKEEAPPMITPASILSGMANR